ncbi:uncharacterized protein E0L32_000340 [Thyridium curvatum]|uniref:Heterokaryon incompatibility domain-containing protein n=1 Tax=Thyridium curvatum TaxID=1093900 RepID=A0A507B9Z1_9PEZI|nr:uncharacterized protein E0L32_000340 [Thyridium curvatum]TPX16006.1 hypothetical protein E0L32_000340 [Thyridium curvatum]
MPAPPFIVSSRAHGLDFVRQIQAGSIDYGIISEWLACCHKHHRCDPLESLSSVAVGNLRLIDCNNRSIVPGSGHKYVTLGYVWGPHARNDAVGDFIGSLPPRLPDTIEDAIQVTKKLGFRYIWIDRYCIDRRDALKFKFQLHQMGDIYRNSSLTIVAAAGDRDSYGLPGVRYRPRAAQPYAKAGSHLLLSSLSDPQELVRESVWATRGWTFQEARLSSRRLYFTEEQVYFECNNSWFQKSRRGMGMANISYDPDDRTSLLALSTSQWNDDLGHQMVARSGLISHNWCWVSDYLWNQIALYTERDFTDPSDVLDGFAGLMGAFESAKPSYRFFWGTPIPPPIPAAVYYYYRPWYEFRPSDQLEDFATTTEAGFLAGLCWAARKPLARRTGFPSWSWTGWSGASCIGPNADTEIEMHYFRESTVDVELRGGNTITWKGFLESRGRSELSSETSFHIHLSAWVTPLKVVASNGDEDVGRMDLPLGRYMHWRFTRTGESALQSDKSYYAVWLTLGGESWIKNKDKRGPGILVVMDTEDGRNTMERVGLAQLGSQLKIGDQARRRRYVILGAGVVGLSTALELKRRLSAAGEAAEAVVVAKHFPGDRSARDYCSPWAGANWFSVATDSGDQERWDAETYRRFARLADGVPEAGVRRMDIRAFFDRPREDAGVVSPATGRIWYDELVGGLRPIPPGEVPDGAEFGFVAGSFVINTQAYLAWLNTEALKAGIEMRRASIDDIRILFKDIEADAYFNCTGLGSYHLKGVEDKSLYPTKGQVMLVETPKTPLKTMYFRSPRRVDSDTTYVFPRNPSGGVILGGCRFDNEWSDTINPELAEDIKRRCCALAPELGKPEDLKVIYHAVGLRPSRKGGPRVERELIDGTPVIHNYGAGGAGYQSSWGTAQHAVDLALQR